MEEGACVWRLRRRTIYWLSLCHPLLDIPLHNAGLAHEGVGERTLLLRITPNERELGGVELLLPERHPRGNRVLATSRLDALLPHQLKIGHLRRLESIEQLALAHTPEPELEQRRSGLNHLNEALGRSARHLEGRLLAHAQLAQPLVALGRLGDCEQRLIAQPIPLEREQPEGGIGGEDRCEGVGIGVVQLETVQHDRT